MRSYNVLSRNRFFEMSSCLDAENCGDHKVGMLIEVDMTSCNTLRQQIYAETGVKPSYTALVSKAIAQNLKTYSYANKIIMNWPFFKRLIQLYTTDISIACEKDQPGIEQAVYVGTIRNVDLLELDKITLELQDLSKAQGVHGKQWSSFQAIIKKCPNFLAKYIVRLPKWMPSLWVKYRGGSVLISSPAKYGVDMLIANWPWPIGFSFGLVKERPFVVEGKIEVRSTMTLTMSFDRRIMGGAPAARFIRAVADSLENASTMLTPQIINDLAEKESLVNFCSTTPKSECIAT